VLSKAFEDNLCPARHGINEIFEHRFVLEAQESTRLICLLYCQPLTLHILSFASATKIAVPDFCYQRKAELPQNYQK
jgi:hypothetical protein